MRTAATSLAERYGYRRIDTGVLAAGEPLGRSGAIIRAYFEGGLDRQPAPARLYYIQPIARPEGDLWQFGVEVIGDGSPGLDAEVIELGWRWFEALRIIVISLQVKGPGDLIASLPGLGLPSTRVQDAATSFSYWLRSDEAEPIQVGAGSRHDQLAKELGFQSTPAAGFAIDMNRTAEALQRQHPQVAPGPDIYGIPVEPSNRPYVHRLAAALRQRGFRVVMDVNTTNKLEARLDSARQSGSRVAVMAGVGLERQGQVVVRDLQQQIQVTVWEAQVVDEVRRVFAGAHHHDESPR
jgi:histidyl-tRNA synthetase